MSSSSPPPPPKHKHKKSKDKGKAKETVIQHAEGRNEGIDPNWAFKPPAGMVALDTTHMDEEYDWEALRDDEDKELWIVRVPEGFKMKQLEGLQIQQPRDAPAAKLSTLQRKRAQYDMWAVDASPAKSEDQAPRRGEELTSISCLLPRKKKGGKLYISPKPIAQHIIVTHAPAAPQIDAQAAPAPSTRQRVPKHLLTHKFSPYGAASTDDNVVRVMDVDEEDGLAGKAEISGQGESGDGSASVLPVQTPTKKTHKSSRDSPGKSAKKRKIAAGEGETPSRSKKLKL